MRLRSRWKFWYGELFDIFVLVLDNPGRPGRSIHS